MINEAIKYFIYMRTMMCERFLKICPKESIGYQVALKEKEYYDMAIRALERVIQDEEREEKRYDNSINDISSSHSNICNDFRDKN